ncbi:MAG: hypothetical protein JWR74_246 [Polaromonas sp.]|nr:hypothetical protein [Polaromonas sp.]
MVDVASLLNIGVGDYFVVTLYNERVDAANVCCPQVCIEVFWSPSLNLCRRVVMAGNRMNGSEKHTEQRCLISYSKSTNFH